MTARWWRRAVTGVLVVCGALGPSAAYWAWRHASAPQAPVFDLRHVEPAVAGAIQLARQQVRRTPRSAEAWGHLGMVLLAHDLLDEARECLGQAERLDPRDARWPYLQAIETGNPDPEIVLPPLERAAGMPGAHLVARLRLAEALLEDGQVDGAESHFRRVLEVEPENPRAHLGLGRVMRASGALDEAVAHLVASAAGAPGVRHTHALLAEAYHRLGQREAAEEHRRVAATSPESVLWPDPYLEQVMYREVGATALLLRAESFIQHQRYDLTLAVANRLVELHPDRPEGHFLRWRVLTARRDRPAAARALREGVRLAPDTVQSLYYQGIDLARQSDSARAAQYFRQITSMEPQFAPAHCDLAESLWKLGNRDGAVRSARECLRYRPNLARGHRLIGEMLAEVGDRTGAIEHLEQADDLQPLDAAGAAMLERLMHRSPGTPPR